MAEDIVDVEMLVDDAVKKHAAMLIRFNEDPFSISNKIAYGLSYRVLLDVMLRWQTAHAIAYPPGE